jgi:hypothetical protein
MKKYKMVNITGLFIQKLEYKYYRETTFMQYTLGYDLLYNVMFCNKYDIKVALYVK